MEVSWGRCDFARDDTNAATPLCVPGPPRRLNARRRDAVILSRLMRVSKPTRISGPAGERFQAGNRRQERFAESDVFVATTRDCRTRRIGGPEALVRFGCVSRRTPFHDGYLGVRASGPELDSWRMRDVSMRRRLVPGRSACLRRCCAVPPGLSGKPDDLC